MHFVPPNYTGNSPTFRTSLSAAFVQNEAKSKFAFGMSKTWELVPKTSRHGRAPNTAAARAFRHYLSSAQQFNPPSLTQKIRLQFRINRKERKATKSFLELCVLFSCVHLGSRNDQGIQSYGPRNTRKTRKKLRVLCIPCVPWAMIPPFIWLRLPRWGSVVQYSG